MIANVINILGILFLIPFALFSVGLITLFMIYTTKMIYEAWKEGLL